MLTESDNFKIPLFCYPITSHQFFLECLCIARGSNLKQFSEIILYWNLDGLLLALMLNTISFITFLRPLPSGFLKQKFLILQRLRTNIFRSRDPPLEFTFVLELYFLLMNVISEVPSISKAEERRFPWKQRCFTYSSASRQFIMNSDLWKDASRDMRPLVTLETTRCKCFSVRGCVM